MADVRAEVIQGVGGSSASFDDGRGSARVGQADETGRRPVVVAWVERAAGGPKTYTATHYTTVPTARALVDDAEELAAIMGANSEVKVRDVEDVRRHLVQHIAPIPKKPR